MTTGTSNSVSRPPGSSDPCLKKELAFLTPSGPSSPGEGPIHRDTRLLAPAAPPWDHVPLIPGMRDLLTGFSHHRSIRGDCPMAAFTTLADFINHLRTAPVAP